MTNKQIYEYYLTQLNGQGQWGERVFAHYLKGMGFDIEYNNTSDYDIKANKRDKELLFEIKTDTFELKRNLTDNVFIEFEDFGKPSGISITLADYYITIFPLQKEMYVIETEVLKTLLDPNNIYLGAGTTGEGKAYLVKKELLRRKELDWERWTTGKNQDWFEWYDMKRKGLI
jgi:hypothetical protein